MRITNKIMRNNNLANINTNKIYQDKLSTQMSTQKKIGRPSEDPVVAIRALRLRSNVTEVTQYYSKNIPDAQSWLEVTEKALDNLTGIITSMIEQCTKGSNGDLTSSDREIIIEQLKNLGEEVYSTGDADFAGRYVFTGYRTDTSLSFMKAETLDYEITEQVTKDNIDSITVVKTTNAAGDDLMDVNEANYTQKNVSETDVETMEIHRIRLAYSTCADDVPTITYQQSDGNGGFTEETLDVTVVHDYDDPYSAVAKMTENKETGAVFCPETGEILLSEEAYLKLKATEDVATTSSVDEDEIRVTYHKEEWKEGNLRPEHYFACKSTDAQGKEIKYNQDYLESNERNHQVIEYDVGFNQTIQVNSTADECFKHNIGREVEDLINAMQDVVDMEAIVTDLEAELESVTDATKKEALQGRIDAAEKALTFMKDKAQRMFEAGITAFQGALDEANLSITNCGTRSSKLELVESRMQVQKTTFETLKSENEDCDITEVAIQLGSAELTYEAALMATGKIMQTTLLNFI
ncbi:MAG: flagellar hook-associated protein FlgL [Lachnospiraceae bacterium]|nr:flagellar hook-associated protein FlgL [Lachnospiraceae bacterium]